MWSTCKEGAHIWGFGACGTMWSTCKEGAHSNTEHHEESTTSSPLPLARREKIGRGFPAQTKSESGGCARATQIFLCLSFFGDTWELECVSCVCACVRPSRMPLAWCSSGLLPNGCRFKPRKKSSKADDKQNEKTRLANFVLACQWALAFIFLFLALIKAAAYVCCNAPPSSRLARWLGAPFPLEKRIITTVGKVGKTRGKAKEKRSAVPGGGCCLVVFFLLVLFCPRSFSFTVTLVVEGVY